jgi:hypothetical protein
MKQFQSQFRSNFDLIRFDSNFDFAGFEPGPEPFSSLHLGLKVLQLLCLENTE